MRDIKGLQLHIITFLLASCSLFHLYTAAFGVLTTITQRSIHLAFLLPLCFIFYPGSKNSSKTNPSLLDWLLAGLALATELFVILDSNRIYLRMEHLTPVLTQELIFGSIAVLLVLEGTRRCVSPMLALITVASIGYMFFGHLSVFGVFRHPGISFPRIIEQLFLLGEQGIHGVILGVSATYAFLFILFGSFLNNTDIGRYIISLASSLFGRRPGGPAKVAIASSCCFASISGSGPANVFATGTFTIPLMTRLGYKPTLAAGIEAAASNGGQFMPPVMGAVGFIIAETSGTPYYEVCKQALLPALLYFFSVYMIVHLEAKKAGLKGFSIDDLESYKYFLKHVYKIIPILVIIVFIVMQYTPFMAGFYGICSAFLLSFLSKDTMMTPKRLIRTLAQGAQNAIMIALACACVGIVAAMVIYTGIGQKISSMVLGVGEQSIYIAPFLTMIICIALGAGIPATPAYVVTAVIALPTLLKLGFAGIGPNLFIMYYAVMACVTPPVAITAYAAASISGTNPMRTSFEAFKVAFVGFVIPIVFLFNKSFLLIGNWSDILLDLAIMVLGLIFCSIAFVGYFRSKISKFFRFISFMIFIACVLFLV